MLFSQSLLVALLGLGSLAASAPTRAERDVTVSLPGDVKKAPCTYLDTLLGRDCDDTEEEEEESRPRPKPTSSPRPKAAPKPSPTAANTPWGSSYSPWGGSQPPAQPKPQPPPSPRPQPPRPPQQQQPNRPAPKPSPSPRPTGWGSEYSSPSYESGQSYGEYSPNPDYGYAPAPAPVYAPPPAPAPVYAPAPASAPRKGELTEAQQSWCNRPPSVSGNNRKPDYCNGNRVTARGVVNTSDEDEDSESRFVAEGVNEDESFSEDESIDPDISEESSEETDNVEEKE